MGQELIGAMQELLDYSEGKIDLKITKFNTSPVCDTISAEQFVEDDIFCVNTDPSRTYLPTE